MDGHLNWLFIICGVNYDPGFRICLNNFREGLSENIYYVNF